jgi:type II secretory pathway component PulF
MVLSDKVGDQGNFLQKLEALESQGFVGRANREQLVAVLDVGHAAAHRGHAPSPNDLEHVMDILENLLQAAYKLQNAARTLKSNTPRRYPRGV